MIYGIGTDLIEVERVQKACENEHFLQRIFTEAEQKMIFGKPQKAAGNYAVKEAVAKAFGTGFGKITPGEIEVLREASGKPYVVLHGEAKAFFEQEHISAVHVSISNTKGYATAYVVLER